MAKTYSAETHRNENASIQFNACVMGVLDKVRQTVAHLAASRKADEYALGALHALRKICEGERQCSPVVRGEVKEWEQVFWVWFERVQKKFTPEVAKKLRANAADDFRVKEPATLSAVAEVLFQFAAEKALFAQYSPPEKR